MHSGTATTTWAADASATGEQPEGIRPIVITNPGLNLTPNHAGATLKRNKASLALTRNTATAALTKNRAGIEWRYSELSKSNVNDTWPPAELTLTNGGQPVDLTDAGNVEFHMAQKGQAIKVSSDAEVTDATNGVIRYQWQPGDTDTAGTFLIDVEVAWSDGTRQTFPPGETRPTWTFTAELDDDATA